MAHAVAAHEGDPAEILRRERDRIAAFLAERGVRSASVFGSAARGDGSIGDIDLLVDLGDEVSSGAELLTLLGLSEELSTLLGVHVDVASVRLLRPEVRAEAVAEAVPL